MLQGGLGDRRAPAPKMPSVPSPASICSSRRESAQTLSLAPEERKGKEVIRLTPDATRGLGDRQAPAPKMPSALSPASIRSSRHESAQTLSLGSVAVAEAVVCGSGVDAAGHAGQSVGHLDRTHTHGRGGVAQGEGAIGPTAAGRGEQELGITMASLPLPQL